MGVLMMQGNLIAAVSSYTALLVRWNTRIHFKDSILNSATLSRVYNNTFYFTSILFYKSYRTKGPKSYELARPLDS